MSTLLTSWYPSFLRFSNRHWSTSSQLDDAQTFPFFARTLVSDEGQAHGLLLFLREKGIDHLGVLHINDEFGNAFLRSLLEKSSSLHPDLSIVAIDLPARGATEKTYEDVVDVLVKTEYRWFFGIFDSIPDYEMVMAEALRRGIVGTGEHTWILTQGSIPHIFSDPIEKDSVIGRASGGIAIYQKNGGRPGAKVYDNFADRFQTLANSDDIFQLSSIIPLSDSPNLTLAPFDGTVFERTSSSVVAHAFDATIALGLAACDAVEKRDGRPFLDGTAMFQSLVSKTFVGATGNVTLNSTTGTRLPETALFSVTNVVISPVNDTHVSFSSQLTDEFTDGSWNQVSPFVYSDGTSEIPSDLPPQQIDFNYIGTGLRAAGLAMSGIILLASLGLALWTWSRREHQVVRASQPIFLLVLCAGTFVMGASIIPLSLDDEVAGTNVCSAACMMFPWLLSTGFALAFAALFSKTWRVNRVFKQHRQFRRVQVKVVDVIWPFVVLLVLNLVVLSAWTAVSPLEWEREITEIDRFSRSIESRGFCRSHDSLAFIILLVAMNFGALVLVAYQSYLARSIATAFAESEHIAKAIVCMLLVSFVGVPTILLVSEDPKGHFFVVTSIIFVLCLSVLSFIFVPKILRTRKKSKNRRLSSAIRSSIDGAAERITGLADPSESKSTHAQVTENQNERIEELEHLYATALARIADLEGEDN